MTARGDYVPLMLRPGWVLEKHLGWRVMSAVDGRIKLLAKRRGPFVQAVLLLRDVADEEAGAIVREYRLFSALTWTVVTDISGRGPVEWQRITQKRLKVVSERTFGVGTFVVDLGEPEEVLWSRLASRARRMCRKAESGALRVSIERPPPAEAISTFFSLYEPMARERGLQIPPREAVRSMAAEGALLIPVCLSSTGEPLAANLVYIQNGAGFYLYGARSARCADGAAHYAHWQTIAHLASLGLEWYDLGQVPSKDDSDGLYVFKRELGGQYVAYGSELVWQPPLLRAASFVAKPLRAWMA